MTRVSAILPTRGRPQKLAATLERILSCDPAPGEVLVHTGADDVESLELMRARFPGVRVLTGDGESGPGGARNGLIRAASSDWVASFDDDSYPFDRDFFAVASRAVENRPEAGVIACTLYERDGEPPSPTPAEPSFHRCLEFANGACLWRRSAFLRTRGHVPLKHSWCMEEQDVGLQLFALDEQVWYAPQLRVFHDSERQHHQQAAIAGATLANVALLAGLRYPMALWPVAFLQVMRRMTWMKNHERAAGILPGLAMIPGRCAVHWQERTPLPLSRVWRYLSLKRRLLPNPHGPGLLPPDA